MEERVEKLFKQLRMEYAAFWILSVVPAWLYESDVFAKGQLVEYPTATYTLQVLGIILMLGEIPLALRLFKTGVMDRVRQLPLEEAFVSYRRWSQVRLFLLLVVVLVNLTCYYLTLKTSCGLCAVMALAASLLCVPSRLRIWRELDLPQDEEEQVAV